MRFNAAICSYLFFGLFVFTSLALLSSEFSQVFLQVFPLLVQNGYIYDVFSIMFVIFAIFLLIANSVIIYKKNRIFGKTTTFFVLITAISMLIGLCFIAHKIYPKFFLFYEDSLSLEDNLQIEHPIQYYTSIEFIITAICWLFLGILPILYKITHIYINAEDRLGKSMIILEPQLSTICIIICASAFHPYLSNLSSKYFVLTIFFFTCVAYIYHLYTDNKNFTFYDYANAMILALSITIFMLCGDGMLRADFYNAQFSFYMLAILSWCGEWSNNSDKLYNSIAS